MALTPLQRELCHLLADGRRRSGEGYVAGGVALGEALPSTRQSRDIDLFHDTAEAVARSWDCDRETLESAGFVVTALRERPGYVEAAVSRGADRMVIEWTQDSAFRFFPLVEDDEVASLAFAGPAPQASELSRQWRGALDRAVATISLLPHQHVGEAVLTADARLFRGGATALTEALVAERLLFHRGRLGGALPQIRS